MPSRDPFRISLQPSGNCKGKALADEIDQAHHPAPYALDWCIRRYWTTTPISRASRITCAAHPPWSMPRRPTLPLTSRTRSYFPMPSALQAIDLTVLEWGAAWCAAQTVRSTNVGLAISPTCDGTGTDQVKIQKSKVLSVVQKPQDHRFGARKATFGLFRTPLGPRMAVAPWQQVVKTCSDQPRGVIEGFSTTVN